VEGRNDGFGQRGGYKAFDAVGAVDRCDECVDAERLECFFVEDLLLRVQAVGFPHACAKQAELTLQDLTCKQGFIALGHGCQEHLTAVLSR